MSDFIGVRSTSGDGRDEGTDIKGNSSPAVFPEHANTDLEDRIKNAINLTHSLAGMTPGLTAASIVQQSDSLFPHSNGADSSVHSSGDSASPYPRTGAPSSTDPAAAPARQVSGKDTGLLSLFNFLTPSDMALPLNDPSALLPTPFAPGQNAFTLQQQRGHDAPPKKPGVASAVPVSSLPAAAAMHLPQYMMHPQIAQHALLQQLMSVYSGGGQPAPPGASAGASPTPAALAGNPPDLNVLMAGGYPASLGPGIGLIPAALNPGMMGLLPGFGPFANMGNFVWHPSTMTPGAASYAMASTPQQMAAMQEQINGTNTNANVSSHVASALSRVDNEPLIKSREARWLIRYNELLNFRTEHGHCRVPHGYSTNRKLSWWVMNQRAQWSHRNQGRKCWLTDERIRMLNDIGFIWTPHLKKKRDDKDDVKSYAEHPGSPSSVGGEVDSEDEEKSKLKRCKIVNCNI